MTLRGCLLVLLALPLSAFAKPAHLLETRLLPAADVTVGQLVTLEVDVLVATWFTRAPDFADWHLPGAEIRFAGSQGRSIQRTVNGTRYSGLTFSYQIRPLQAGDFTVPTLGVTLTAGQAESPFEVETRPLTFTATLPRGLAGRGPTLIAERVEASQRLLPSTKSLRAGDVLVREVSLSADGSVPSAMPPLPWPTEPGLVGQLLVPEFEPLRGDRGRWRGTRRIERMRYLLTEPGAMTLPAITVDWWNSQQNRLETIHLPALSIDVASALPAEPAFSIREQLNRLRAQEDTRWPWLTIAGVLLVAIRVIANRRHRDRVRAALTRILQSLHHRWQQSRLRTLCHAHHQLRQSPAAMTALYRLLHQCTGNAVIADTPLPGPLRRRLLAALAQRFDHQGDRQAGLKELRRTITPLTYLRRKRPPPAPRQLPPLNPPAPRANQR